MLFFCGIFVFLSCTILFFGRVFMFCRVVGLLRSEMPKSYNRNYRWDMEYLVILRSVLLTKTDRDGHRTHATDVWFSTMAADTSRDQRFSHGHSRQLNTVTSALAGRQLNTVTSGRAGRPAAMAEIDPQVVWLAILAFAQIFSYDENIAGQLLCHGSVEQ